MFMSGGSESWFFVLKVLVSHGGVEIGQGLDTKMIQVASRKVDRLSITEKAQLKILHNNIAVSWRCRRSASTSQRCRRTRRPTPPAPGGRLGSVSISCDPSFMWTNLVACRLRGFLEVILGNGDNCENLYDITFNLRFFYYTFISNLFSSSKQDRQNFHHYPMSPSKNLHWWSLVAC